MSERLVRIRERTEQANYVASWSVVPVGRGTYVSEEQHLELRERYAQLGEDVSWLLDRLEQVQDTMQRAANVIDETLSCTDCKTCADGAAELAEIGHSLRFYAALPSNEESR